jgi:uncharacterized protein YciU (UPF0263 family)
VTFERTSARFVIDESGFEFTDDDPEVVEQTLLKFVDLLSYANETGTGVVRWSEIFYVESHSGRELHELLFSLDVIDRDIRVLFGRLLEKVPCWNDHPEAFAPSFEFGVGDTALSMAPAVGLCTESQRRKCAAACLTTDQSHRRGPVEVVDRADDERTTIHFLVTREDAPLFWRFVIGLEDLNASEVEEVSELAFPRLLFSDRTWARVDRFEGKFRDYRDLLIRDLSGLNDYAVEVWKENVEPARIIAEMRAKCQVSCSRESSNTHRNSKAMAERIVRFDGADSLCEWHTKLEGHRNRIHFEVRSECVLVGIFDQHLS